MSPEWGKGIDVKKLAALLMANIGVFAMGFSFCLAILAKEEEPQIGAMLGMVMALFWTCFNYYIFVGDEPCERK